MSGKRPPDAVCANCVFWWMTEPDVDENGVEGMGECRRDCPPIILVRIDEEETSWRLPKTAADYGCGEFEEIWELRRIRR